MKRYKVRLYYHSSIEVEVSAINSKEAVETARSMAESVDAQQIVLDGLVEDDSPDVEPINCNENESAASV